MDDLIADAQSILRLKVTRNAMLAASRVCKKTAEERRIRQLMHPTRILRTGATAVFLSTTAAYFRSGSRWEGYRSRYRRSHVKKLARPIPMARHAPGRMASLRKFASEQFALSQRLAHDMRRLGGRLLAPRATHPLSWPSFGMLPLPRVRLRKFKTR
jgi:hypothetical protein